MSTLPFLRRELVRTQLADIVGVDHVVIDPVDLTAYGLDFFWVPRMLVDRGIDLPLPDVVVLPTTTEEVREIVRVARRHHLPIVPWGGGSGSQGGVMPIYGGITIDLKRMNRVVDIDEQSGTVTAQAGINGYELETILNDRGWMLPHYPASVHAATLGGYLAARGSGVLSTKYGKAEDLVMSIEVVLADGEVVRTLSFPNHAAGPGILQVFVGSEGTLGVITEATMRIVQLPEERRFRALLMPSTSAGLEAGRRIMRSSLQPLVLRLYDEPSTQRVAARTLGVDIGPGAYMEIGFDGWGDLVERQEVRAVAIASDLGAQDLGRELGEHWWRHRYDFYFPPHVWELPWLFGTTDTLAKFSDIERLWESKRDVLQSTFRRWDLEYIAHFSHWYPWGVMVYDRFLVRQPPSDPAEAFALHEEIWARSVRTSLEYGGILNEHHGVGLKLARYMREQHGGAFLVMESIKRTLDPENLLNPGKLGFDLTP